MTFVSLRIVRIEWGDCDAAGIVFYPRYFAMFNESTSRLFEAAGFGLKRDMQKRFDLAGWPMADTRARFLRPARYGDDLRITTRISAMRRSSFDVEHLGYIGEELAIEGFETRVWTRPDAERPGGIISAPIPDDVRKAVFDPSSDKGS